MKTLELNEKEFQIVETSLSAFIDECEMLYSTLNDKDEIDYFLKLIIKTKDIRTKLRNL